MTLGLALGSLTLTATALGLWLARAALLRGWFDLNAKRAGLRRQRRQVGDHEWVWLEAGDGPPLVLVHGFTGAKENWLGVASDLARTHRVLIPDLPGWGESERRPGADYGYPAQAERLASFIAAECATSRCDLVGHSMGGGIAAVTAARHPGCVDRLVLMSASGVRFRDNAFGVAVLEGDNPFGVADASSLKTYLRTVFEKPPFLPWPLSRALIEQRIRDRSFEDEVLAAIGRDREAFLPGSLAPRIAASTLLLWTRDDPVIDFDAARIYDEAIPDSRIECIDSASHMPMIESPAATTAALLGFLRPAPG